MNVSTKLSSLRVSSLLVLIACLTVTLLTVLMHFKYHVTTTKIKSDLFNVASRSIVRVVQNGLKLGIDIKNMKEVEPLTKKTKTTENSIRNVVVFDIQSEQLQPVFLAEENQKFSYDELKTLSQSMYASKEDQWKGSLNASTLFAATRLKDAAGRYRAIVTIFYDNASSQAEEKQEIENLYKRLFVCLLVIAVLNFMSGYINIKSFERIMETAERSILKVFKDPKQHIDLSDIVDPSIRSHMRSMITVIKDASLRIVRIEGLMKDVKKDMPLRGNELQDDPLKDGELDEK